MRQKKGIIFIFLIAFIILGVAITLQFKTILNNNRQKAALSYTVDRYKAQLQEEKSEAEKLRNQIEEYEKKKEEYLKIAANDKTDDSLKQLIAYRDDVMLKAGLTAVKGPGIVLKLDDAEVRKNEDVRDIIIHDSDIVRVLNVLKIAGAQAISVNGERIIAVSEQICAGPTIRINKKRYAAPFEIKAAGDPDQMEKSLNESEIISTLLDFRIRVQISKQNEIIIPRYENDIDKLVSGLEVVVK